jgi:microcystin degradation protein MlrC
VRLATVGFYHEANTYSPVMAGLGQWRKAGILEGDGIRAVHESARTHQAGQLGYGATEPDVTVEPLVYGEITPTGISTKEAFEHLAGRIIAALHAHGPWDGVLMPLHGAAVAEGCPDADGELISRVRAAVGPDVPIGVTLDMHANVSPAMVEQADVITMFQTNPHVDAFEQGMACAELVGRTVRGELRPVVALAALPLAINILRQGTGEEPMAGLLQLARDHQQQHGVLGVYLCEGFPYADVPEMGASVLAIADGNPDLAREVAHDVARVVWERRGDLVADALGVDDALRHSAARVSAGAGSRAGPVVVLDTGDNVGGGSPGDSTHVLHAARRLGIGGVVEVLTDPEAVALCSAAGLGAHVTLEVGGKTDDRHGAPFTVTGVIAAEASGRFEDPTLTHGGARFYDVGPTVRVSTTDQVELVLMSRPLGTVSLEQLRIVGLEPVEQRIIVAKGVHSPRAAFEPIAAELVLAATPGCTSADLSTFAYRRRRRPMFPFEPEAEYRPG